ncbi:MAG: ribosomal L7Ae/L30e/S12e/Gadd45 family protein [Candidatus Aenigmarchaeota archaeon]|nr:ribosomal L7Ae/L30e/S12e/Gadd45 family protein [Candidatus Aenigmarchaeota archaeon]
MKTVETLPEATPIIGIRSVLRSAKNGKIKKVIVAKNCPATLVAKLGSAVIEQFPGDQKELGTKLGKPFPIAVVGYTDA